MTFLVCRRTLRPCVCGHAPEEHDPECRGTVEYDGVPEPCRCIHYEQDREPVASAATARPCSVSVARGIRTGSAPTSSLAARRARAPRMAANPDARVMSAVLIMFCWA